MFEMSRTNNPASNRCSYHAMIYHMDNSMSMRQASSQNQLYLTGNQINVCSADQIYINEEHKTEPTFHLPVPIVVITEDPGFARIQCYLYLYIPSTWITIFTLVTGQSWENSRNSNVICVIYWSIVIKRKLRPDLRLDIQIGTKPQIQVYPQIDLLYQKPT